MILFLATTAVLLPQIPHFSASNPILLVESMTVAVEDILIVLGCNSPLAVDRYCVYCILNLTVSTSDKYTYYC